MKLENYLPLYGSGNAQSMISVWLTLRLGYSPSPRQHWSTTTVVQVLAGSLYQVLWDLGKSAKRIDGFMQILDTDGDAVPRMSKRSPGTAP